MRAAFLYTIFPARTETFLLREVRALRRLGLDVDVYSVVRGRERVDGFPVRTMTARRWLSLSWRLPAELLSNPRVLRALGAAMLRRRPPYLQNLLENLAGFAFAIAYAPDLRAAPPSFLHATWATAPAAAAWLLHQLTGAPYSMAGHAYDVFRHGGDWLIGEKLAGATFVQSSTELARERLVERGARPEDALVVRRGLDALPVCKPLRSPRTALRILCVARLVGKKGISHQLAIYAALVRAGVRFEARIAGGGPLRRPLERLRRTLGLGGHVTFLGHLSPERLAQEYAWADVLVHTGVVADCGDRDGLPNVLGEAMAHGLVVLTSPEAGVREAIRHQENGLIADPRSPAAWVELAARVRTDDDLCERLRCAGRAWVEESFDAHRNGERLLAEFRRRYAG